ncbi:biogenesis of lysosome-related organelles complex 1 subunit 3 [Onthophagus taurus]|uniref:biogenesis of lysosome-related organelles complex 1 subunit 3 n=1 Tax=Onthophagus taurus TaxID=166361 RepID=UPI0039BE2C6C
MSNKAVIVSGEASETDSDDDIVRGALEYSDVNTFQASVIQGEDSESDQEIATPKPNMIVIKDEYTDSLLHKKLRESNLKLCGNINNLANGVLGQCHKTLSNVEQDLVKCQLTMQSAVSSLQHLTGNSNKIKNNLDGILSSSFLSSIKTN